MLAVPADRLPTALAELDPGNRALLDLSLRRGVSDAEIGQLLRKRADEVARGRDAVLELLADALEVGGHDRRERVRQAVAGLPDEAWRAPRVPDAPAPSPPASSPPPGRPAEPAREPAVPEHERAEPGDEEEPAGRDGDARESPPDEPERPRPTIHVARDDGRGGRRAGVLAALGLLVVVVALALILFGGDDEDEPAPGGAQTGTQPAPGPGAGGNGDGGGQAVPLRPLAGERGQGRVTVAPDGQVVISVSGLPRTDGSYQAWLYDSIVDTTALGTIQAPRGRLEVRLPDDASSYRFIDISQEPPDGNANHSGDSVLRAPVGELLNE